MGTGEEGGNGKSDHLFLLLLLFDDGENLPPELITGIHITRFGIIWIACCLGVSCLLLELIRPKPMSSVQLLVFYRAAASFEAFITGHKSTDDGILVLELGC